MVNGGTGGGGLVSSCATLESLRATTPADECGMAQSSYRCINGVLMVY